jgi:glucokinase
LLLAFHTYASKLENEKRNRGKYVFSIGLDMGGTKCAGVLVDDAGSVIASNRVATPTGTDNVIEAFVTSARELIAQSPKPVGAVGCGIPGLVTTDGVLRFAPHLPGVVELPLQALLVEALQLPVTVANDNTCAAWGEYSIDRTAHTFLYVGFGTGIGGGVVVDDKLLYGSKGFSGEIGHMVVEASGPECVCGRRGCWEIYASGSGLARLARAAGLDLDGPGVRSLLRQGSTAAAAVVETFSRWVAIGLTNLIFTLDPDMIVLGGGAIGLPEEAPELIEPIQRYLALEFAGSSDHRPMPSIRSARLGPQAGAIGAAKLALEQAL